MFDLTNVRRIKFPAIPSEEATLYVYETGTHISFSIQRVFVVRSENKCKRGFHAHKESTQLLVSLNGKCLVTCDDGRARMDFQLQRPFEGLFIPPTIWAEQTYEAGTILKVLTDSHYNEEDYLRDYEEFLFFRGVK